MAVKDGSDEVIAEYYHDGLNQRIAKAVADGEDNWNRTDYYHNEAWQVLEEREARDVDGDDRAVPADATYCQYVWDLRYVDAPVVAFRDENRDGDMNDTYETVYYCTDANMNVTALVYAGGCNVLQRYVYDPYGRPQTFWWYIEGGQYAQWWSIGMEQGLANEILYAGYRWDPETGLYHVRNRMYAPHLGRWMQRDPAGYAAGEDMYLYGGGNPLMFVDPRGLVPLIITGPTFRLPNPQADIDDGPLGLYLAYYNSGNKVKTLTYGEDSRLVQAIRASGTYEDYKTMYMVDPTRFAALEWSKNFGNRAGCDDVPGMEVANGGWKATDDDHRTGGHYAWWWQKHKAGFMGYYLGGTLGVDYIEAILRCKFCQKCEGGKMNITGTCTASLSVYDKFDVGGNRGDNLFENAAGWIGTHLGGGDIQQHVRWSDSYSVELSRPRD